uniref:Malonyl-CoA decarboxylase C-terminal domain-containing protein n=1 Tax=Globisporangium ultimum (strain ATCC 200006 / CBS 805.95 / DAOM BR144) TaxID=431595 RepID=K3X497_GLOUD
MIQEVVKTKANTGDFVPRVVIESLCSKYRTLNIDEKKHFLLILARDLHVDTTALQQSLSYFHENMAKVQGNDALSIEWGHENIERYLRTFRNLRQALSPLYETFFQQILSQREGGMLFLVHMRADLLQILRKKGLESTEAAALRSLDVSLKNFLASWFSVGFLNLERVTYERSSGRLLEKIIRYEAVHPVGTIIELKRRLGKGRRCFAFFHPSVPDEPLVFVHVALVKEIASSMQYIREETETMDDEHDAKAAIFYSISSTQKGLQGVDLGNFLIKEVAKALKSEHTQLETFATLSPMPQFVVWLETHRHSVDGSFVHEAHLERLKSVLSTRVSTADSASAVAVVLKALAVENWWEDAEIENALKPILLKLGAQYIYQEKKRGKALCPVSNFHIRNGAIFERINWLADPSPKGLHQSAGMMVNYKYDLQQVEANNENYLLQNIIPIGDQPKQILES